MDLVSKFRQPDGSLKLPLEPDATESEKRQKEWFDNLPHDYKGASY